MSGFVCVYYGNTGSSWLLKELGTSHDVLVPGFEPVEGWAWDAPIAVRMDWIRAALNPPEVNSGPPYRRWAETLRASPQVKEIPESRTFEQVGFKMNDLAVFAIWSLVEVLEEANAKVIVLTRSNRIKHALSLYRYHEEDRGQFGGKTVRPPSRVKLRVFNKWLRESERLHAGAIETRRILMDRLGPESITDVTYEDFVTDEGKRETIDRLCDFLEIDRMELGDGQFVKATPDDLRSAVVNYNTLRLRYLLTTNRVFFDD